MSEPENNAEPTPPATPTTPPPEPVIPTEEPLVPLQNSGNNVRSSWRFSQDTVRLNLAHCAADRKEPIISAFLWCIDKENSITMQEFAAAIGVPVSTVEKVFMGRYKHPDTNQRLDIPDKMVAGAIQFLKLERERRHGGQNEFVVTPTARKIWTACDLARESGKPGFIIGPSHIGKTWAFERYEIDNNHGSTRLIRMKAASGLGGMVRRMAERLGVSANGNTLDLVDRIKTALTKNMLLILDEMHLLQYTYRKESFFACLEVIREIYDETKCGMILCGTKLFMESIRDATKGELQQLLRRGVHRVNLPNMPTKEDLRLILEHSGLSFPDEKLVLKISVAGCEPIDEKPYEILGKLAKTDGLLAITERIRYARKFASKAREKITWGHFVEAHLRIASQATQEKDWYQPS